MEKKKEFYKNLKKKLIETTKFPTDYLFKFIVETKGEGVEQVENLFDKIHSISKKESKNGKYTSISAKIKMESADAIIKVYQRAEKIDNIISL